MQNRSLVIKFKWEKILVEDDSKDIVHVSMVTDEGKRLAAHN